MEPTKQQQTLRFSIFADELHLVLSNYPYWKATTFTAKPYMTKNILRYAGLFGMFACAAFAQAQKFTIPAGTTISICITEVDDPVAKTALDMFASDAKNVLNSSVKRVSSASDADINIHLNKELPREGFRISVQEGKLDIAAADAHGAAYGTLELSRLMGVSPWEWWADCTPRKLHQFSLPKGYENSQSPAVAYRGIFINDEDWGLNPWAKQKEGIDVAKNPFLQGKKTQIKAAIGPQTNERIFQLLLRLRANYYWPAMHEVTMPFFLTEGNREMAARYGIYMGGSHCEPMACSAAAEWGLRGEGSYNYVTNREAVQKFWADRVTDVSNQEILYTIGMRGVHDGAMEGVKTAADKLKYLQMVIDDQRRMLDSIVVKGSSRYNSVAEIPQVFVPYKEVLDIYRSGLQVPDDVTLMWTDDNYGYIRQFPTDAEQQRSGGSGIYYHVSYWGRPHDYTWLSSLSPSLVQYQMRKAFEHGIQKIWVLNVGDIKPAEYLTELFLDMAWNGVDQYDYFDYTPSLQAFLTREFGKPLSKQIIPVMQEYYDLAADRKPEHVGGQRVEEKDKAYWNLPHPISEWNAEDVRQRIERYTAISDKVERLWTSVPEDRKDAFFQLVKYPVQAAAQMNFKFLLKKNAADKGQACIDSIASLTRIYNKGIGNGGKWDGIMSHTPRNLAAFGNTGDYIPDYRNFSHGQELLPRGFHMIERGKSITLDRIKTSDADSIAVEVRLMPNHPINDSQIAFTISIDDSKPRTVSYKTFDREETWKQNVLRNYATRTVVLPVDKQKKTHTVTLGAATDGVVINQVFITKR